MRLIRIVFLYAALLVSSVMAFGFVEQSQQAGMFALGVLLGPALIVWWNERRIDQAAKRRQQTALSDIREMSQVTVASQPPAPVNSPAPTTQPENSVSRQEWQNLDLSRVVQMNREQLARAAGQVENPSVSSPASAFPVVRFPDTTGNLSPIVPRAVPPISQDFASADVVAEGLAERVQSEVALGAGLEDVTTGTESGRTNEAIASPGNMTMVKQGWVPKGQSVVIHGRQINGMIYIGTAPVGMRNGYSELLRPYIDPSLSVSRLGRDPDGTGMSYWPSYSGIPSECRATYLDWLAAGASDGSVNPGFGVATLIAFSEKRWAVATRVGTVRTNTLALALRSFGFAVETFDGFLTVTQGESEHGIAEVFQRLAAGEVPILFGDKTNLLFDKFHCFLTRPLLELDALSSRVDAQSLAVVCSDICAKR